MNGNESMLTVNIAGVHLPGFYPTTTANEISITSVACIVSANGMHGKMVIHEDIIINNTNH